MTSRRLVAVRAIRSVAGFVAATSLVQCTFDAPPGPRALDVRAIQPVFAKSASVPAVASVNPSYGDQGTTIDVQILGNGFSNGASVSWLLNGVADDHVHTNSAKFVSSTEIDANITIASDATIAAWDVQVALIGGKNGVGSEAFVVTTAQVLANVSATMIGGTNDLLEVGGFGNHAFVIDDALRYVDLGPGQVWGLEPRGSTAVGSDGKGFPTAWSRQPDGSWVSTRLPPAPSSIGGNARSAAYAPDGSLLVAGFDATGSTSHSLNRPVVWRRATGTWTVPMIYTLPPGTSVGTGNAVNGLGQMVGNIDASNIGAVWDSPTTPTRLDGLPNAINSTGTLIVGQRYTGTGGSEAVYWWRDPVSLAWHTTGVVLPSISGAVCGPGAARGLNDAGVVVGKSCNAVGDMQATVWMLDLSTGVPILIGSALALPGIGRPNLPSGSESAAVGINSTPPYFVAGSAFSNQSYPVRWMLR